MTAVLGQVVRLLALADEDRAPLVPRLDAGPDAHDVVAAGVADDEQRARSVRGVLREVGLDPDGDRVAETALAFELEAALLADDRAGAVAPDDVPGDDLELRAPVARADPDGDGVGVLAQRDHFVVEPDVGAEVAGVLEHDRLEDVLGDVAHLARARGPVLADPVVAGAPRHHPRQLAPGERGREDLLPHEVVRKGSGHDAFLDAEVPQDLDGPLVGDVRPRRVRGARTS